MFLYIHVHRFVYTLHFVFSFLILFSFQRASSTAEGGGVTPLGGDHQAGSPAPSQPHG